MKLKLTLGRPNGSLQDIVVTTDASATVGEVAEAIRQLDPYADATSNSFPDPTLRVTGTEGVTQSLSAGTPIAEAPIASGSTVAVAPARTAVAADGATLAVLRVVSGPDAGKEFQLRGGGVVLGRSANATLQLDDPLVSKFHARVEIGRTLDLVDLNSANGLVIDGQQFSRVSLETGQTVLVGGSMLRAELLTPAADHAQELRGPVSHVRSPRVEARYLGEEYQGPEIPHKLETQPFPIIAMIAPVIMGVVLYSITRNPITIAFVALSPVIMLGTWLTAKMNAKRKHRDAVEAFEDQIGYLGETLEKERAIEREIRLLEAPSTAEVLEESARFGSLLWTRRPEHWSFLNVRLGVGLAESRNSVAGGNEKAGLKEFLQRFEALTAHYQRVDGVPLVENLADAGALGLTGETFDRAQLANALLAQIAGLYSPAEVSFAAIAGQQSAAQFDWLKWLPHVNTADSPMAGASLSDSAGSAVVVLGRLEELIETRATANRGRAGGDRGAMTADKAAMSAGERVGGEEPKNPPGPYVVVLVAHDAPVDPGRLIQLTERAADAGILPIWLADTVEQLPAACRTYVELLPGTGAARVGYVRVGRGYEPVQVERLAVDTATAFARHLAGVTDASIVSSDASDIPQSISLATLLGTEMLDSADAVVDRWRQNDSIHDRTPGAPHVKRRTKGKLRAIVGQTAMDAMHLDLRTQGPHALVGGTTGAGKSEFLQAWVLGMAAEYSPDRVTFLFVDYKGGSAFADCVALPHTVGLVTDLSPHLVRRALTSLRAELHHREHLFNRKKVKDLLELERSGDPESPPALIIVIDEFAALVGDVPEFVDGVVDIAQRGRSLGIHLILATQRPAGVIRDNLRANTNLRVALRMADESDSTDVLGVDAAGHIDPSLPGRGIAKTGPGRLQMFQSGYAGGWTSDVPEPPKIDVAELRFGSEPRWEPAVDPDEGRERPDQGPNDQARLVAALKAGSVLAEIPPARRPWLDELANAFDLTLLRQRTDTDIVLGVSDLPHVQQQLPVYFRPDIDGHLAVYGSSGTGKTVTLRTVATAAGITPRGGPVNVYGLDFGTGGLRMLEALPHVGSVVGGDDPERVVRLLRMLKAELEARGERYSAVDAGTIADYRRNANAPDEPRILLVVDNFPSFRNDFEVGASRAPWYAVFQQILSEGRGLGIHVAMTADRPGSVPNGIASAFQRRVVHRLADDGGYVMLDTPADVLTPASPPGRAIIDGYETQIAIAGGDANVAAQAKAIQALAQAMERSGRRKAPVVGTLATEFPPSALPATAGGLPVLGIADDDLQPIPFTPSGTFVLSGPPASGRTNALEWLIRSVDAAVPGASRYYLGNPRSAIGQLPGWEATARTVEDVQALAKELAATVADPSTTGKIVVVVEQLADFLSSSADGALVELIKAVKRSDHFLIAENESGGWASSWPLLAETKGSRTGFLLQPETMEGDTILKTSLPRVSRAEFPPGRGYFIARGKAVRVQLPLLGE